MQTLKEITTVSLSTSDGIRCREGSLTEKKAQNPTVYIPPTMMAGAKELQKALACICHDASLSRRRCRDMMNQCWDSFIR